jgi:hypothetical protein
MLPPDEYQRAAREADYHIQVVIENIGVSSGEASLSGSVVNVFRGPPELRGKPMTLQVNCFGPGEEEDDWPPDGVGRLPVDSLRRGRVLEALVNETESGMEIALGLCTVIDSTTSTPQLQIDFRPTGRSRKKTALFFVAVVVAVLLLSALFLLLIDRRG